MVAGTAFFSLPTPRLENSASGSMPGSIETVSEHLKKRLPVHFPFFIAHSLITNGTVTVLVSHHLQVDWPASITAWSTLLEVRLADTFTMS